MSNVLTIPQWTIGDRLKKARNDRGIGNGAMADLLGTSRTTVTNYEAGRSIPDAETLGRWCSITGVSADWVLDIHFDGGSDLGVSTTACNGDAIILTFPTATQVAA